MTYHDVSISWNKKTRTFDVGIIDFDLTKNESGGIEPEGICWSLNRSTVPDGMSVNTISINLPDSLWGLFIDSTNTPNKPDPSKGLPPLVLSLSNNYKQCYKFHKDAYQQNGKTEDVNYDIIAVYKDNTGTYETVWGACPNCGSTSKRPRVILGQVGEGIAFLQRNERSEIAFVAINVDEKFVDDDIIWTVSGTADSDLEPLMKYGREISIGLPPGRYRVVLEVEGAGRREKVIEVQDVEVLIDSGLEAPAPAEEAPAPAEGGGSPAGQ